MKEDNKEESETNHLIYESWLEKVKKYDLFSAELDVADWYITADNVYNFMVATNLTEIIGEDEVNVCINSHGEGGD